MPSPLTNIALVTQSSWRFFFPDLVKQLKQSNDCAVHLYCASKLHADFYRDRNSDNVFATISVIEDNRSGSLPEIDDDQAVFEKARNFERLYGATINEICVADRHLGRGYALGGYYHPRSPISELSSYAQVVELVNQQFEYWEREIEDKNITLFINQKAESAVAIANAKGIPVRNPFESRHKNYHHWAIDGIQTNPAIEQEFNKIDEREFRATEALITAPPTGHMVARNMHTNLYSASGAIRLAIKHSKEQAYNYYKGNTAGQYYLTSKFKLGWRRWSDARKLRKLRLPKLADMADQPFVFFPLHVEPEVALQGQSPEYLVQLSAIVSLSRDLPAGYRLVVKEHLGAVGRRPRNFYDQIMELKNVIFMEMFELGKDIVQKAEIVATISGSAGLEAAVMGKPVIVFGRHNGYEFLPHVRLVDREVELKAIINEFLEARNADDPQAELTRRRDGERFIEAVKKASFDLGGYNHITGKGYNDDDISATIEALIASLALELSEPPAATA